MTQDDETRQEPTTAIVARRVAALRKARGISAQDLAERCAGAGFPQLDRGIIANLESGRRKTVSIDEVLVLACVLDVAPVHLFVPPDDSAMKIGKSIIGAGPAREWVRGNYPLPSQESRIYRTEVPDHEWDAAEAALAARPQSKPDEIRAFVEEHGGEVVQVEKKGGRRGTR